MTDWIKIEEDVTTRIRALAAIEAQLATMGDTGEAIRDALVVPCGRLIAAFCAAVQFEDDDP